MAGRLNFLVENERLGSFVMGIERGMMCRLLCVVSVGVVADV